MRGTMSQDLIAFERRTVKSTVFYLGFPFAKLLLNFCGTKRKIFLSLRISFARKTTICAIIRKSHFAKNCPIPLLRNSSFAQFCN